MADLLLRPGQAAGLWLSAWIAAHAQVINTYRILSGTCGTSPYSITLNAQFGGIQNGSGVSATFLGTDSCGIGYWNLTSFTFLLNTENPNVVCCVNAAHQNQPTVVGAAVNITNNNCSQAIPATGILVVVHHIAVVACYMAYASGGNNHWAAFAGGDAATTSIADAKTACVITSEGCDTVPCPDIDVTITGLT